MTDTKTKITVKNDGSLLIEGDVILQDASNNPYDLGGRTKISLCRCGASANKPFCDGAHKQAGFSSTVTACKLPAPKNS